MQVTRTNFHLGVLVALVVGLYSSRPLFAESLKIGGTGGALGVMHVIGYAFKKENPKAAEVAIVPGLGSGGGKKALMGGALDIAVTSRPGQELEKLDGAVVYLYGRAPFVFAASKKVRASDLKTRDLIDIYNGKKISWPDGERLRLILRPETDSDTELLKSISPAMAEAVKSALVRAGMKIAVTDEDSADAIESTPGGFGTSILPLILSEKRSMKVLAINGVIPSPKTIGDGTYPWFKSFYLITKGEPTGPARQLIDFVLSPRGCALLLKLGHSAPEVRLGQ